MVFPLHRRLMGIFAHYSKPPCLLVALAYLQNRQKTPFRVLLLIAYCLSLLMRRNMWGFAAFTKLALGHLTCVLGAYSFSELREYCVWLMGRRKACGGIFQTMRIPKLGKTRMKNCRCFYLFLICVQCILPLKCVALHVSPSSMILDYNLSEIARCILPSAPPGVISCVPIFCAYSQCNE